MKSPAPRSISVEELKLIRMETGMVGRGSTTAKWETKIDPQDAVRPIQLAGLSSPAACTIEKSKESNYHHETIEEGGLSTIYSNDTDAAINDNHKNDSVEDEKEKTDEDEYDSDGETEGANGILHKRKDLTSCSDAASSLTSPIVFSELKMKELIGGGGFGQVPCTYWAGPGAIIT